MSSYFHFLGKEIPLYGIFFYIGILLAALTAITICKKRKIPYFDMIAAGIYIMIGAMLGSKLLFIAVSWKEIIEYHLSWVAIIKGGFVFYGGLIGGTLGLLIYTRLYHLNFIDFSDVCATVLPLGHALGRIGCFFAGCCYGIPYHGPLSHTYNATVGTTPIGIPLLPIQLIESALLLLLFILLFALFLKKPLNNGLSTIVYLCAYSALRFALEFFRGDTERGFLLNLSTSQWISIVCLLTSGIYLFKKHIKKVVQKRQN